MRQADEDIDMLSAAEVLTNALTEISEMRQTLGSFLNCNKNEYNHTKCTVKSGLKGEPGNDGTPGMQGIAGQRGPVGLKGDTGRPGPEGPTGEKGTKGEPRHMGLRGEPGDKDMKGNLANSGNMGEKGVAGSPGVGLKGVLLVRKEQKESEEAWASEVNQVTKA